MSRGRKKAGPKRTEQDWLNDYMFTLKRMLNADIECQNFFGLTKYEMRVLIGIRILIREEKELDFKSIFQISGFESEMVVKYLMQGLYDKGAMDCITDGRGEIE